MKSKIRNTAILILICTALVVAMFDIMSGIFLSVFANTIINYILFTRQKSKTTIKRVKKERPMTVDEFKEREMSANPHRPYPRHNPHPQEFTD